MCGICLVWDTPTIFWRTLRRNVFLEQERQANARSNFFYPRNAKVILLHLVQRALALKHQTSNKQSNKHEATSSEKWPTHDTKTVILNLKCKSQTCFKPLWAGQHFPCKCRIRRWSCFPTISDGFRPVSDLFGLASNFHINVGSADIAAFLQFQTVSDLFQTSLGWPAISI